MEMILEPGGVIPHEILADIGANEKEPLNIIKSKLGIIIMKQSTTLTDLLSNLVKTDNSDWDEMEYSQYLLERSK